MKKFLLILIPFALNSEVLKFSFEFTLDLRDYSYITESGRPRLPCKVYRVLLPPGAVVRDVKFYGIRREIEKKFEIEKTLPKVPLLKGYKLKKIEMKKEFYPEKLGEFLNWGSYRQYKFVTLKFYPFAYDPQSDKLYFADRIDVEIEFDLKEGKDYLGDIEEVRSLFVNWEDVFKWYTSSLPKQVYDYVIICPASFTSSLQDFIDYKESAGFNVYVMPLESIVVNYSGVDTAQKIRNFLREKYLDWGIKYLLICGDINTIPMRKCCPWDNDADGPDNAWWESPVPTDLYYADLSLPDSQSWDKDGDGLYGEYAEDNVDVVSDIAVGRIPYSDTSVIKEVLEKIKRFETELLQEYKKSSLQAGAILFYQNENSSGYPKEDGATLIEKILSAGIISRSLSVTLYEKAGLDPSVYECTDSVCRDNILKYWRKKGIFHEVHHGWLTSFARKVWATDDGDGVPEDAEITAPISFVSGDASNLHDDYPSFVYLMSCLCGYPENADNVAFSLLRNGASGVVGASRAAWGVVGWQTPLHGGAQSLDYYYFYGLLKDTVNTGNKVGDALAYARSTYYNVDNDTFALVNIYEFNLYGEPSMKYYGLDNFPDIYVDKDSLIFKKVVSSKAKSTKKKYLIGNEIKFIRNSKLEKGVVDTLMPPLSPPYFIWEASYRNYYEATRFEITRPCTLYQIWHGVVSAVPDASKECSLFVWKDNNGVPGERLCAMEVTAEVINANTIYWNIYDLTNPLYIENSFWIGNYEMDTSYPTTSFDTIPDYKNMYGDGSNWYLDNVDYFHAAVVSFVSGTTVVSVDSVDTIIILNLGKSDLIITGVNTDAPWIIVDNVCCTLSYLEDCYLPVKVDFSQITGSSTGYVIINSNDPGEPEYKIKVIAQVTTGETERKMRLISLKVYPNPARDRIIFMGPLIGESEITIYDAMGREVKKLKIKNENPLKIDVSNLSSGVYFYRLVSGNKIFKGKFVKIR